MAQYLMTCSSSDQNLRQAFESGQMVLPSGNLDSFVEEFEADEAPQKTGLCPCTFFDLRDIYLLAKDENVTIDDDPDTIWFAYFDDDGKPLACSGLKRLTDERWLLRGAYTLREYRGVGLGGSLVHLRVQTAIELGIRELMVHSRHPTYYLARGWQDTGERRPSGAMVLLHTDLEHCLELPAIP